MHRSSDPRLLAVVLCGLWATQFIVQRLALEDAPPLWIGAGRTSVAALVLLTLAGRTRALDRRGPLSLAGLRPPRDRCGPLPVVSLGLANQTAFVGLQVAGLRTVAAGPAAAIVYLQPVLVLLASAPVLGERLTARKVLAALLGFAGVAVVGLHQASASAASV